MHNSEPASALPRAPRLFHLRNGTERRLAFTTDAQSLSNTVLPSAERETQTSAAFSSVRAQRAQEVRNHLGHLDALRGLAVLGVMSVHTGQFFQNSLFHYINDPGMRGVQLFFMVSAFTLVLSAQKRKQEKHPILAFFLRRYFRLAPLCYVFILIAYIWFPPFHGLGFHISVIGLFFVQGLSPTYYFAGALAGWSLGVEALFYACFPFLSSRIRDLRAAVLWCVWGTLGTTVVWAVMAKLVRPDQWSFWSYFSFVVNLPAFLVGFLCFFVWQQFLEPMRHKPDAKWLSASILFVTGVVFLDVLPINGYKTFFSSIFCAGLLLAVSLYEWPLLVNRVTIFLGKISYSMYLNHVVLLLVVFPWLAIRYPILTHHSHQLTWWFCGYLTTAVLSAAIGTLTWLYIEEPGIHLGRSVIRALQHRTHPKESLAVSPKAVLETTNTPDAQF